MAFHSTTPLRIPELLFEIASNLPDLADISRLSRCDRMSHKLTMPLLFRNIRIPIQKATPVAYALRKYPHYSRGCRSFTLDCSSEGVTSTTTLDTFHALFEDLAVVLLTLADNARVKSVWWCGDGKPIPVAVPTYVWEAFGKLSGSLEELRIVIREIEENWHAICAPEYSQLRTLDISFEDTAGLDSSRLKAMLTGLRQLEDLYIHLPIGGAEFGVDLSDNHPHLRRFSFSTGALDGQAFSFLHRHPTIECLCIDFAGGYILSDGDLPQLKALRVDGRAISDTPGLLSPSSRRPITHLRVDDVEDTTILVLHQLVGNAHSTLRHLELTWCTGEFREGLEECITLLELSRRLEELRIIVYSDCPLPLCEEDLVDLLLSLGDSTNIARLRFTNQCGEPLSESFLSDVGVVPASLEYISWEVQEKLVTYRLESREGKTVAVPAELPYSGKTILDFHDWLP